MSILCTSILLVSRVSSAESWPAQASQLPATRKCVLQSLIHINTYLRQSMSLAHLCTAWQHNLGSKRIQCSCKTTPDDSDCLPISQEQVPAAHGDAVTGMGMGRHTPGHYGRQKQRGFAAQGADAPSGSAEVFDHCAANRTNVTAREGIPNTQDKLTVRHSCTVHSML